MITFVYLPGAGISTAAGIGDFRGKDGKWTNQAKQKEYGKIDITVNYLIRPIPRDNKV